MEKLIVLIDLHCDASMPSGAEEFGGGNMYTRNLIKCLLETDIYFIYITRKKFPYLDECIALSDKATFFRIDLGNFSYNDKDLLQDYTALALEKIRIILRRYEDCYKFVFHSFYWQSGIIASHLSNLYDTYYIHSVLSNAERKVIQGATTDIAPTRIKSEHQIFEEAKYIICSSQSESDDLRKLYHIPKEKLFVTGRWIGENYRNPIYLGNGSVRTQLLTPHFPSYYISSGQSIEIPNDINFWTSKSFVYFGRIHKNKGIIQIIQAWEELYQKYGEAMPSLWIVGGVPCQISEFCAKNQIYTHLIEKAEKCGKIIWWGTLTPEGISTLMLKALAVIMHSKYEAGGITVLEAMSQGVPVIATPFGFAKDYIIDGENGFLVNYNDITTLKQRMICFINQPYLSNYMGRKARYTVSTVLANWNFFASHLALYEINRGDTNRNRQLLMCEPVYKNSVDIFPYHFNEPSDLFIRQLIQQLLNERVLTLKKADDFKRPYIEWELKTTHGVRYFYYLFPLLNELSKYDSIEPYVFTPYMRTTKLMDNHEMGLKIVYIDKDNGFVVTINKLENYL